MTYFADTNSLYGQLGRDLLLTFRERGLVDVYWSEYVLGELIRARARIRNASTAKVAYLIATIRQAFPTAIIPDTVIDVPAVNPSPFPDPADVAIVAGAIACKASAIITANTRDFPRAAIQPYGLQTVSLDEVLAAAVEDAPVEAREAIDRFLRARHRPRYTPEGLAHRLTAIGMPGSAATLRALYGR